MSSKIYFSEQRRRPLSFYPVRTLSALLNRIAPALALRQVEKLLLTPATRRGDVTCPAQMKRQRIAGREGELQLYSLGEGRTVLLTHGWSGGASQFFPLMQKIAAEGYKAVAFDHYGHGQSAGRQANLPLFIKGLEDVVAHCGQAQLHCVVSHSMGTVSALNVVKEAPHVLIAPTFGFYDSLRRTIFDSGIAPALFERLLARIETVHRIPFREAVSERHIGRVECAVHIVHDEGDRFAPFSASRGISEQYAHVTLHATQGQGHGRVIDSEQTWRVVSRLCAE
ncbi:MAG: alpha/beta fold hydrolase [Pseudomonadales bacterium]